MAKPAYCPYCKGMHRTARAARACEKKHTEYVWRNGRRVPKGKRK